MNKTTLGPRPRHNTWCVKSQENNTFPSEGADASKCQAASVIMWLKLTLGFQSRSDKMNKILPTPILFKTESLQDAKLMQNSFSK